MSEQGSLTVDAGSGLAVQPMSIFEPGGDCRYALHIVEHPLPGMWNFKPRELYGTTELVEDPTSTGRKVLKFTTTGTAETILIHELSHKIHARPESERDVPQSLYIYDFVRTIPASLRPAIGREIEVFGGQPNYSMIQVKAAVRRTPDSGLEVPASLAPPPHRTSMSPESRELLIQQLVQFRAHKLFDGRTDDEVGLIIEGMVRHGATPIDALSDAAMLAELYDSNKQYFAWLFAMLRAGRADMSMELAEELYADCIKGMRTIYAESGIEYPSEVSKGE